MSVSPTAAETGTSEECRKPTLRHLLEDTDRFVTAVELVTSRGVISDLAGQRALTHARALAESPRIDVLSITDNPRATPCSPPTPLAPSFAPRARK